MKLWIFGAITSLAVIAIACSAAKDVTDSPTPSPSSTPNDSTGSDPSGQIFEETSLERFERLLSEDDLAGFARASTNQAETWDYKELAGGVDPGQVANIDSWFGTAFDASDGASLTFSMIDFDSAAAARVWGRGAVDIKGPLAAQVHAVASIAAGERPLGDVYVTCVVQEEIGGVGARHLAETLTTPIVVVGEPSSNTVRRGHRGRSELVVHLVGRSAHASVPAKGVNPLTSLGRFLAALDQAERADHPDLGPSTVAPTLLRTDQTSANVIPGELWLTCDWRNVPAESAEDALASLERILAASLGEGTQGKIELPLFERRTYTGKTMTIPANNPAYILPPGHPAIVAAARTVDDVTGERRPVGIWEFATDGGHYAEAGMAPVGFGPGDPYLAHTVDENIEVSELETAIEVNRRLALVLPVAAERNP